MNQQIVLLAVVGFAALVSGRVDAQPVETPGAKPISPASWIKVADYPSRERPTRTTHTYQSGSVGVLLRVDATGRAIDCKVQESSEDQRLDDKTCALLIERSRFEPARDDTGQPVASDYVYHVNWRGNARVRHRG